MKDAKRQVTKRQLIGRKIVDVDFHPFDDGRGGTDYDPVLVLDDGRRVYFRVSETDTPLYSISMHITDRKIPK